MSVRKRPLLHASPDDAEIAFYEALQQGDVEALIAVWSEDEETVCIHPTGVQLVGLGPIRESWRSIFSTTQLRLSSTLVAHWQGMLFAIHHLVETFYLGDNETPHGPFLVTHVYSRGAHGWRLITRHASTAGETPPFQAEAGGQMPRILH